MLKLPKRIYTNKIIKENGFKIIFIIVSLSVPSVSFSKSIADAEACQNKDDCPYLFEMVSGDSKFKKAIDGFMTLPETANDLWIPEGTTAPSLPVTIGDSTYILFSTCQPHNCGDNGFILAYQIKTNKIVGLHIIREGERVPINSPSKIEIAMMTDFDNGNLEKLGKKLPIKYEEMKKNNKSEDNSDNEAIRSIVERCEKSMGEHGPSIVKGCVDNDLESLQQLGVFLKKANEKQKEIIANCTVKMKEHGWAIVKGCVENDLNAQQILDKLKN